MITLIHITGDRLSGKSFMAHRLATTAYPDALVFEEHWFGDGEFDREIGNRRFRGPAFGADAVSESMRGQLDFVAIVVGDRMTYGLKMAIHQLGRHGVIDIEVKLTAPEFNLGLPEPYRATLQRAAR